MKSVYMAGPITGLNYNGAVGWREKAHRILSSYGIRPLSPMRGKGFLANTGEFSATCVAEGEIHPLAMPRGIMTRDFYDATTCDVLLVNLLGAKSVSIGSVMEIGWAFQKRTPIVCAIESDGSNVHEHAMIDQALGYRVPTLDLAIDIVLSILAG